LSPDNESINLSVGGAVMSKTFFDFTEDLFFTGRGSLINASRDLSVLNMANCIRATIVAYQEIAEIYLESVTDDGKIIGIERGNLLEYIDLFFDQLILLWKSIGFIEEENRIYIENKKGGFLLIIRENNLAWEAEGRITPAMQYPFKKFSELFHKRLSPQIQCFLSEYAQDAADRFFSQEEKERLKASMKQILYYVFFLRYQIENCLINI